MGLYCIIAEKFAQPDGVVLFCIVWFHTHTILIDV